MDDKTAYTRYFPQRIKSAVQNIAGGYADRVQEIRLRVNRPLCVYLCAETRYLCENGDLSVTLKDSSIIITQRDIKEIFDAICQYSVHSFSRELANGFVTVQGGHRVGLCGTAVYDCGIHSLKHVSGLNFRIAREVKGCSDELYENVFKAGPASLLTAGPPSCGKTTVLRDLCRRLGQRYKISVIDERGEIAAVHNGIPQNDIGVNTDIFDGYSKSAGIEAAIRVMSPRIIICDEIGNRADAAALEKAAVSGVKIIASIHADSLKCLEKKSLNLSLFDYIAFLGVMGKVNEIVRIDENAENHGLRFNNYYNGNAGRLLLSRT